MTTAVSVAAGHGQSATLHFDSSANLVLAMQLASQISAGVLNGSIITQTDSAGPPGSLPAGTSGAYVQSEAPFVALPRSFPIDLVTRKGAAVVLGSSASDQVILSDAATDLTFLASEGSGTVAAGGGNNAFLVSGTAGQHWALYSGNGNDDIHVLGDLAATVGAGAGRNAIRLGSGNSLVLSGGDDLISAAGGNVTVDAAQARSDFVQGGASHLLFLGGAGGATIIGGSGSDTYSGAAGHAGRQLIEGGAGGNNVLIAGDGAATLVGGGRNDLLEAYGTAAQWLQGGAGNETLSAALSRGNDSLVAGSGNDQLIGGMGNDTFVGGAGNSTVTAGAGRSVFTFINHEAGGTEVVQGLFQQDQVRIELQGYSADAVSYALLSQTVTNGAVTISLPDGTRVTFDDISRLTQANFGSGRGGFGST
jgi:Ca2+-binding RTX toxin-like protein